MLTSEWPSRWASTSGETPARSCGGVRVSDAVDIEWRSADLPGEPDEGAVEAVGAQRPSERVGEHERAVRVIDPGQSSQLPLVVLLTAMFDQ